MESVWSDEPEGCYETVQVRNDKVPNRVSCTEIKTEEVTGTGRHFWNKG